MFSTHSMEEAASPKNSEKASQDKDPGESASEAASKSDDPNADSLEGGCPKKDGAASSTLSSSSKLGEQRPQIPMELLHLQVIGHENNRSYVVESLLRGVRRSTAIESRGWLRSYCTDCARFLYFLALTKPFQGRQQSESRRRSGQEAKVRVDRSVPWSTSSLYPPSSSRAIKRKRFDDEIVATASCIAPPGQQGVAPILGSSSTLQSQQQKPEFPADKNSLPTSPAPPTQPPPSLHFTAPSPPASHRQNSLTTPPSSAGGSKHPPPAPASAAAAHSKGKGVGKIAKSRGASSLGEFVTLPS